MVTMLAARWQLGTSFYRETGDVDLGIPPIVARDHRVASRLKDISYVQVAGNRFARGLSDIRLRPWYPRRQRYRDPEPLRQSQRHGHGRPRRATAAIAGSRRRTLHPNTRARRTRARRVTPACAGEPRGHGHPAKVTLTPAEAAELLGLFVPSWSGSLSAVTSCRNCYRTIVTVGSGSKTCSYSITGLGRGRRRPGHRP